MNWTINFYNEGVARDVKGWPSGIYADFLRLAGMMEAHGTNLRMPHSRAMGEGLFELRCKGSEGIARAFYYTMVDRQIVSRKRKKRRTVN